MSKVKIKIKLNEQENNINGILTNNKLKFILDKKIVTITINKNNIIMERKHNDNEYTYIYFDKKNPEAYYFYKNKYTLNIEIIKMKINDYIEIKYKIENQIFDLKIEYKEVNYDSRNIK